MIILPGPYGRDGQTLGFHLPRLALYYMLVYNL